MSEPKLIKININDVFVGERLRQTDPKAVRNLKLSLEETTKLIQPIAVRPSKKVTDKYELVVGAHRLEAAKLAGWDEIDAIVEDLSDEEAQLREVDDNIYRTGLNGSDAPFFLLRRLDLFVFKGGKLSRGRRLGKSAHVAHLEGNSPETKLFYDEIKEKFGIKRRTAEKLIRRGKKIPDSIWCEIRKNPNAYTGAFLDKLAGLEGENPGCVVKIINETGCSVRDAVKIADEPTDEARESLQLKALTSAWGRAGEKVRRQFLAGIKAK